MQKQDQGSSPETLVPGSLVNPARFQKVYRAYDKSAQKESTNQLTADAQNRSGEDKRDVREAVRKVPK